MQEAFDAFKTCREAGDRLSPRKLQMTNIAHAIRLKKRFDALVKEVEEDRREGELIAETSEQLQRLTKEIKDYLEAKPGTK